jgi:hypothetical protein
MKRTKGFVLFLFLVFSGYTQNIPPIIDSQVAINIDEDSGIEIVLGHLSVTDADNVYPNDFTLTVFDGENYSKSLNWITPSPDFNGTLTVQVQVNDGEDNSNIFDLEVTVNPIDDAPKVIGSGIQDIGTSEDASQQIVYLPNYFEDVDSEIIYSVQTNTNSSLVTSTVTTDSLVLDYQPDKFGTATITIVASSNGKSVSDNFTITVQSIDDPPYKVQDLQDVNVIEDANNVIVGLASIFEDIDTDNNLFQYSVQENSNQLLVSHQVDNLSDLLTLDFAENAFGTSEIIIGVNSGGLVAFDTILVTVTPQDDSPEATLTISDKIANEDDAELLTLLMTHFKDIDSSLEFSVEQNSNPTLVTPIVSYDTLKLYLLPNSSGVASFVIRASSNGLYAEQTFTLTVQPVDDDPFVLNPISDVNVLEDAPDYSISLGNVFYDIDSDVGGMTYYVANNDNEQLISTSFSGNNLILDFNADENGTAEILVTGQLNGLTATDTFNITVGAQDDSPYNVAYIGDFSFNEDDEKYEIPLLDYIKDIDSDLNFSIISGTNDSLISYSIKNNHLELNFNKDENGVDTLVIEGESLNLKVYDTLFVSVQPVDDAPFVKTRLQDIIINEDLTDTLFSYVGLSSDIDNDTNLIFYAIDSIAQNSLLSASVIGDSIIILPKPDQFGESLVVFSINSNGLKVYDSIRVTINPIDDAPYKIASLDTISRAEDQGDFSLNLKNYFDDIDSEMIFSVVSVSNINLNSTQVVDSNLVFSFLADSNGINKIVYQVSSGNKSITDSLILNVIPVDDPPRNIQELEFLLRQEDEENINYDLYEYFTDIDSPDSLIQFDLFGNSNPHLTVVNIENDSLKIDFSPNEFGTSEIIVRVYSGALFIYDTLNISIQPIDDLPFVLNPINDIEVEENTPTHQVDIAGTFTDVDNEDVNIKTTIFYNSNDELILPSLKNNILTFTITPHMFGEDSLIIAAESNTLFAYDTILVNVVDRTDPGIRSTIHISSILGLEKYLTVYVYANEPLISEPQLLYEYHDEKIPVTVEEFVPDKNIYKASFELKALGKFNLFIDSEDLHTNTSNDTLEAQITKLITDLDNSTQISESFFLSIKTAKNSDIIVLSENIKNFAIDSLEVVDKIKISSNSNEKFSIKWKAKDKFSLNNYFLYTSDESGKTKFIGGDVEGDFLTAETIPQGIVFISLEPERKRIPKTFKLFQNYPNPFNPSTTIEFDLPEKSLVSLKIYNALGQLVKTLKNSSLAAGNHKIKWFGDNNFGKKVSSGIYFYNIKTKTTNKTMKMVFIK